MNIHFSRDFSIIRWSHSYLKYNTGFQFCCAGFHFYFLGANADICALDYPWRDPSQVEKIQSEKTELGQWHQVVSSNTGPGSPQLTASLQRKMHAFNLRQRDLFPTKQLQQTSPVVHICPFWNQYICPSF